MDMLFIWEPQISGEKALSVVKSLGFHCFEIVDAVGFFVGLWLLRDNNKVNVEILGTFDQSLTACLPWLLVGDFKEMLSMDDKMGGVPVNRFKGFKSWFESHDMVDLSFSGPRGPNPSLSSLEVSLMDDFKKVIEQEFVFWKQKSRLQWLMDGDRNTKFFHLTTVMRRRRYKIERLKNSVGVFVEEAKGIKALAVRLFYGVL
ncbi:hypothetical protein L3X38_042319 [Prunus dulcis]|uniref:DUF4283 domain-containing protein n=1 Tax=Prunus dulcis TaxID=3755 RepID=A0AAD4UUM4_PRUDU|nr:hypothetical protein L3X38_042319 [Prunus dulcis]